MPGPREFLRPVESGEPPLISYSQNGEDVRLWRVLHGIKGGFYVDIGAADPTEYSITRLFYDRGWSGINVEPGPMFPALEAARPRDLNLRMAVGAEAGVREFWVSQPHSGLSTLGAPPEEVDLPPGFTFERAEAQVKPASEILEQHLGERTIDFISIDVEGAEAEVIRSLDLAGHRPRILVIEAVAPLTHEPSHEIWEPLVLEAGYRFATFDGINRFYVETSEEGLIPPLAYPLSPLDRFVTAAEHRFEETAAGLRADVDQCRAQVDDYRAQLAELYASRTWRAGRAIAGLAQPADTARRVARRVRRSRPAGLGRPFAPLEVLAAATAEGQPWHYPRRGRAPRGDGNKAVKARAARVSRLTRSSAPAFAREAEELAWADSEALHTKKLTWEERQALTEAAALAQAIAMGPKMSPNASDSADSVVLIDARSLQDPLFARRGVGLHALAVVRQMRELLSDQRVVFLTAPDLPELSSDLADLADVVATTVYELDGTPISVFLELSPMTHSAVPFAWCRSRAYTTVAIVFDFIPDAYPRGYLHTRADLLAYRSRVRALADYDLLLPISDSTDADCRRILGPDVRTTVVHVADPLADVTAAPVLNGDPFALLPVGGDPRKNPATIIVALRLYLESCAARLKLVVTGGLAEAQREALVDLATALGLEHTSVELRGTVSDAELAGLCEGAELVIVPSYVEGYSIPVVQAVHRGAPVVASDIAPHRELVGSGAWLADPADARGFADAISFVRQHRDEVLREQQRVLGDRADAPVVRESLAGALTQILQKRPVGAAAPRRQDARPRVAVVSPYPPQASGVADYTEYTFAHVAHYVDIDVYSAAAASARRGVAPISTRPFFDGRYDAVIHVLGNSHFHFPMLDLLGAFGGAAIAHDNRMFEAYRLDRGDAWTARMVSSHERAIARDELDPLAQDLDELPAVGYLDIARRARPLVVHGRTLARRIAEETGVTPELVEFVPYKVPREETLESARRARARISLGFAEGELHVATFGIVDYRTKATDRVVGGISWLRTWGRAAQLHVVGDYAPTQRLKLEQLAAELGIPDSVLFHGRVDAETLEQFHLAVDVAVQLRTSELLSLSGALADCIAYGVPTVTTPALAEEMDAPFYVATAEARTSSLAVAEAISAIADLRREHATDIEQTRRDYLRRRSPDAYARNLLAALGLQRA